VEALPGEWEDEAAAKRKEATRFVPLTVERRKRLVAGRLLARCAAELRKALAGEAALLPKEAE